MEGILLKIILFPLYFLKMFFKAQIDLWRYIIDHKTAQKIFILIGTIILIFIFLAFSLPDFSLFKSIKDIGLFILYILLFPIFLFFQPSINIFGESSKILEKYHTQILIFTLDKIENPSLQLLIGLIIFQLLIFITSFIFLSPLWIFMSSKSFRRTKVIKRAKLSKIENKVHKVREKNTEKYTSPNCLAGIDQHNRFAYLDEGERVKHLLHIGTTGSGKTISGMIPLISRDIKAGLPILIIDNKADRKLLDLVYSIAKSCSREDDFLYFSLSDVKSSNTYNPLAIGDEKNLLDLIIHSFIWGDPFYFTKAKEVTESITCAFKDTGNLFTFLEFEDALENREYMLKLAELTKDKRTRERIKSYAENWRSFKHDTSGLLDNIRLITSRIYRDITCSYKPQINLFDAYFNNKIVLFSLDSISRSDVAKSISKMVIQNLKVLVGYIISKDSKKYYMYPVFIDEFMNSVYKGFTGLIGQCREAGVGVHLYTQSIGDFKEIQHQILENTNIKVISKLNDPYSIQTASDLAGTYKTYKETKETEKSGIFFKREYYTGKGSEREVREYQIHPDDIRRLNVGEAFVITGSYIDKVYLVPEKVENIEEYWGQNKDYKIKSDIYNKGVLNLKEKQLESEDFKELLDDNL